MRPAMLRLYHHRINSLADLARVPTDRGVELDLRSDGDRVIVTHDPFTDGVTIEEYFPHVGQRPCIFNVKCEGIEARVIDLAAAHRIEDFFFLDLSVPAAVKLARRGESRIAVRYSEYEPAAAVLAWAGLAQWVWVDCFEEYPPDVGDWARIAERFRVCLVSPELQGHGAEAISSTRSSLGDRRADAVCTKRPDLWID